MKKAQKLAKRLEGRQKTYDEAKLATKGSGSYHRPGSLSHKSR